MKTTLIETTLIDQGLNLMLFGMGTVFVFLTVLVFATSLMSRLVNRLSSSTEEQAGAASIKPVSQPIGNTDSSLNPQIVTAIEIAIAEHRSKK